MSPPNKQGWAKEPYVWLILLFPLLAIVGGVITTWLAVSSYDGLVVDDYYKRGLESIVPWNVTWPRKNTA